MRIDSFDPWRVPPADSGPAVVDPPAAPPPAPVPEPLPPAWRPSPMRWLARGAAAAIVLLVLLVAWLAVTAPLSKSLEPPVPPSITLLSAEGDPIARHGAVIGDPVDATRLPDHVTGAFLAIEDRRFRSHWGIDPRGIARAFWNNSFTDNSAQGGSTITQQLAKNVFLSSDRTLARKLREVMIAFWLEAWLSKDEILSRYLSNVYFGDNVYGLSAAARHYFSRDADDLTVSQAAMLAGLVKAPSRLAPTQNLKGARDRQAVVVGAMEAAGYLTAAEADDVAPARLKVARIKRLPTGTYFADWVLPQARDNAGAIAADQTVQTTLEMRHQRAAERAVRAAGLRQAQVAIVSMRPDGRIIAMVGGKDYAKSPFNRATQARRQPGSTFKLFVYLAALRAGMDPDDLVDDSPVTIADWSPKNSDGRYRGEITLAQAFAQSSNVAAARLTQQVGPRAVIRAARDLGISTPIPSEATIALGTSSVSLLELTAAYAAIAAGEAPVRARGLAQPVEGSWLDRLGLDRSAIPADQLDAMRAMLAGSIERGTGRQAALSIPAFGKTGTTQDNRDALFVGYADGIVTGVWVGNDDNTPNAGLSGGGVPARIWRDYMTRATGAQTAARAEPAVIEAVEDSGNIIDDFANGAVPAIPPVDFEGEFEGLGINLRVGPDGGIEIGPGTRTRDADAARRREEAPDDMPPEGDEF
ncbi:transglycosylase domain-containing protein [Sphingomonas baiyangensis]|uniref:PBP1A family penicillin-binding protein n=1 Tax=Sphingomonas baiyangensis TaxID=2572576 RepID=A0A4U1L0Y4_9SPHN|nr:PBP1A family penicillin-binding protein [Sphingomonas baiyangensis]TKD50429.1 PBP1A family penicillin-binding protein [Sphingomonas baiyangensis]